MRTTRHEASQAPTSNLPLPLPSSLDQDRENLSNRWWRLNNLYWIKDKKGRKVPFRMNPSQEHLFSNLWYMNLILKARQRGFTTLICLLLLDSCLFNDHLDAGVIAHNREDAEDFFHNKIRFAYDNLPDFVKATVTPLGDTARHLRLSNGSSIKVGTSLRSGTFQMLLVSEFGKLCARYPEKAKEVVTGALNTVQAGQFVFVESTAEGQHGYFYDYCKTAQDMAAEGRTLTPMDFKFFFYPWWEDEEYVLDPEGVLITSEEAEYFTELAEKHGIHLSSEQQAWYVKKLATQQDSMKREYPSTPEEAFLATILGAYYVKEMTKLRADGRMCRVPYEPSVPVNTGWDLGMDDTTAIWFHQRVGLENRIIDYYEQNGEGLAHYAKVLQDRGYLYGTHYLPHDIEVRELGTGKSRKSRLEDLGLKNITTISRELDLADMEGVEAVRAFLHSCYIDPVRAAEGVKCLDSFQKHWDDKIGGFRNQPMRNFAIHGADAFKSLALGYSPKRVYGKAKPRRRNARVV